VKGGAGKEFRIQESGVRIREAEFNAEAQRSEEVADGEKIGE
jgi:hypothetical protein